MSSRAPHERFEDLLLEAATSEISDTDLVELVAHRAEGCDECARFEELITPVFHGLMPSIPPRESASARIKEEVRSETDSSRHAPWDDYVILAGTGGLGTHETDALRIHLDEGCSRCLTALEGTELAGGALADSIQPLAPSRATTEAIKARVRASSRTSEIAEAEPGSMRSAPPLSFDGPLVGRSEVLAEMKRLTDGLRRGEGGILTITSDPGVGKSRLVHELSAYAVDAGIDVLVGACTSSARTCGYSAFVEIFAELAEIPDDADEQTKTRLLTTFVKRFAGERSDEVFPALARLMGIDPGGSSEAVLRKLTGQALENRIHESTRYLLKHRFAGSPAILVFEDLHWADDATVTLLEAVMPLVELNALLLVAVSREVPESPIRQLSAFADEHLRLRHHRQELRPLDLRDSLILARRLSGTDELAEPLTRLVSEKSGGNPFYIEEIVRAFVQSTEQGDSTATAFAQQGNVETLILSHVARLSTAERRLLETASAVGQRVPKRLLEKLCEDPSQFDTCLAELENRQFLRREESRETGNRRVARLRSEAFVTFRHALVRDAVLESIAAAERYALHSRCAAAIEALYAARIQDHYGVLAYQHSQARQPAKAQHYLILAGEAAATSAASADALYFFREAHATYQDLEGARPDKETEARLERNIALALLNTGHLTESIAHFNAALRLSGQWVPEARAAVALRGVVDLTRILSRLYTGRLGNARHKATEKEQLIFELLYNRCRAQNIVDDSRRAVDNLAAIVHVGHLNPKEIQNSTGILASAGAFFSFAGISFDPSHRLLSLARNAASDDDSSDEFLYRTMAFVVNHLEGDWSEAHHIATPLLEQGLRYGQFWDADVYLGLSCEQFSYQGRFERADEQIERIEELCDSWGYEFARSNLLAETAILALCKRQIDGALAAEQRWYDLRNEESLHYQALGLRARAQVADGLQDAAEETLRTADSLVARSGARMFPFYSGLVHCARLAHATVKVEELAEGGRTIDSATVRKARAIARAAVRNARGCARDRGDTLRLDARLEWALGNQQVALERWSSAIAECERLDAQPDLGRTLADMSVALEKGSDEWERKAGVSGDACRARAIEVFESIDCRWDLEQLLAPVRRRRAA